MYARIRKLPRLAASALALGAFVYSACVFATPAADRRAIQAEATRQHDATVKRLQDWIARLSIAAENRNYPQPAVCLAQVLRDAGFRQAVLLNTAHVPDEYCVIELANPEVQGIDGTAMSYVD